MSLKTSIFAMVMIAVVSVGLIGCTCPTPTETKASESTVIGHLKTHDKFITIRAETDGPRYTVKSAAGEVLAADLSAQELFRRYPNLQTMVEKGMADWAGMDLPGERSPLQP